MASLLFYYEDIEENVLGPVSSDILVKLFENGEIDGMTRVCPVDEDVWKSISEVPQLREMFRKVNQEEAGSNVKVDNVKQDSQEASESVNGNGTKGKEEDGPEETVTLEDLMKKEKKRLKRIEQRKKRKERWNEEVAKNNTSVYFTGIPEDVAEEEVVSFFSKCGILKLDPYTGKPKLKLYRDEQGNLKGDGVVTYALQPSVENALKVLDDTEFRLGTGKRIHIEPAKFELKGDRYIPKPKEQKTMKPIYSSKLLVQQKTSWNEGIDDGRGLRIIILKNVFDPKEAECDTHYYEDIKKDIEIECLKLGELEKVTVFEKNPEGVVAVRFQSAAAAESCIEVMSGRWFGGRQLVAEYYDGKTDYRHKETEEERKQRIKNFEDWLGADQTTDDDGLQFLDAY
eukprot:jgi/Galph1/135/GphlegSOOS_G4803.1